MIEFRYLGSTAHDANRSYWMGDIALALSSEELLVESVNGGIVAVLLLRFSDPGSHLVQYVHIIHDKLSLIRSKKKTSANTRGSRYSLSH